MIRLDWRADVGALLLLVALIAAVAVLRRLPRYLASGNARAVVRRWLVPLAELATAVTAASWLLTGVTRGPGEERLVTGTVLVLAFAWAFRSVLQDFANGIALRMDGLPELGEWIRAGGSQGRVRRIGYRSMEIETTEGTRLALRFSTLAQAGIERSAASRAARAHTFTVRIPDDRPLDRTLAELPGLVLLSPWASPAQTPEVRLLSKSGDGYTLELTAIALDPAFASEIEATVRAEIARRYRTE